MMMVNRKYICTNILRQHLVRYVIHKETGCDFYAFMQFMFALLTYLHTYISDTVGTVKFDFRLPRIHSQIISRTLS